MLVDMKPQFLRFPGGNYLEGDTIDRPLRLEEDARPARRSAPATWPVGLPLDRRHGAAGVPALVRGHGRRAACSPSTPATRSRAQHVKPGPELEPFVQEALDEIEYVTGAGDTEVGRAAREGRPSRAVQADTTSRSATRTGSTSPAATTAASRSSTTRSRRSTRSSRSSRRVGNEQPEEQRVHSRKPDVVDEHYYRSADEFLKMSPRHYEKYDRKGPEIFVGEWAAHEDASSRRGTAARGRSRRRRT